MKFAIISFAFDIDIFKEGEIVNQTSKLVKRANQNYYIFKLQSIQYKLHKLGDNF
jgi:hypothetical protein